MISAAMKMVTDMERIGDHAADISEITIMLSKEPYVLNLDDIKKMASETVIMLIRSIEAYVEKDMNKAQEVIRHDDIVDDLFDKNKADIIELIRHDPEKGEQAADMLMVAKYFERIGDHATNIAEWVIFALNDKKEIKELVTGKICMVTGGGGSIGSELVRQIAKYSPKQVIIVDIYENNAYDIQQELVLEYGNKLNLVTLISSIRDYDKMELIFKTYRPQLVFHAAAHKHVPLMETVPEEAVKNNIFGTFNVATLAEKYKADKFVMISTDKAVNPTNVMGATKRACEMIIQHKAQHSTHTEFVTTRFGNVLGSNGSVIPLFRRQIESGSPVTVTHPDIIRYFMTIPEAVSLVLEAGAMAHGGEIFVLDMGAPVKITTLAENLIRMYGKIPYKDVPIVFTGLRPGEKLFEELLMDEEGLKSTANEKIFIGNQININSAELLKKLDELKVVANSNDSEKTVELLADLVPTFNHKTN